MAGDAKRDERAERLAAALRENLRRRKQAARFVSEVADPEADQRITTIEPSQ